MMHTQNAKLDELREAFREYLRRRCVKYTKARELVLDAVFELRDHFEAEQALYLLRERGHRVGKATVYRTLPLLMGAGIVRQVQFDAKHAHYELAFQEEPHDHLVCRRCGRVIEFGVEEVTELCRKVAAPHRFHVVGHRFQITGLCWECATACPVVGSLPSGAAAADGPG